MFAIELDDETREVMTEAGLIESCHCGNDDHIAVTSFGFAIANNLLVVLGSNAFEDMPTVSAACYTAHRLLLEAVTGDPAIDELEGDVTAVPEGNDMAQVTRLFDALRREQGE